MRWKKMVRDASAGSGRIASIAAAIAVGIASVAAISTAYGVIAREINESYLATRPASAEIQMDRLDQQDLAAVRSQPGVAWAEAAGREWLRVKVGPDAWLPLLLFVVPDFSHQHIGILRLESGEWPNAIHGIVLERTAMPVANALVGGAVTAQTAAGVDAELTVTGVVHDPSLAPASQQQTVYGYATAATLRSMGMHPELRLLKISVTEPNASAESTILAVANGLIDRGHRLGEVRIPPRHHPHWGLMVSVIDMLLSFSVLAFLLASVLTATLTASFLAPQLRHIGVMKAIGARDGQIVWMYAALIGVIGVVGVGIGLPLGCAAGRALARTVGRNLNFDLHSVAISSWIYVSEAVAGVGLPLLASLWPIVRAARRPVREALDNYGIPAACIRGSVSPLWKFIPAAPALRLAIRNSVRRRSRLVFTLTLLAAAGALFITSLNLSAAWQRNAVDAVAERHFDLEVAFAGTQPTAAALALAAAVPGVSGVEEYSDESVSVARDDGINLTHTFPDGGHGSLRLDAVRPDSKFLSAAMKQGSWIRPSDARATEPDVVMNEAALGFFPGIKPGDPLRVLVRGRVLTLKMIGLIGEHLAPATLYLSSAAYAAAMGESGMTRGLRVSLERGDESFAIQAASALEQALDAAGLRVAELSSKAQIGRAYGGHLYILIFTLGVMAVLMAIVGVLGLASAMGTSVLERTREFAVMRALGAGRRAILCTVILEGVFIGIISVACASLLAVPCTLLVANIARLSSLGAVSAVLISAEAIPLWMGIVLIFAAVASAHAARSAVNRTIPEALAYQ